MASTSTSTPTGVLARDNRMPSKIDCMRPAAGNRWRFRCSRNGPSTVKHIPIIEVEVRTLWQIPHEDEQSGGSELGWGRVGFEHGFQITPIGVVVQWSAGGSLDGERMEGLSRCRPCGWGPGPGFCRRARVV